MSLLAAAVASYSSSSQQIFPQTWLARASFQCNHYAQEEKEKNKEQSLDNNHNNTKQQHTATSLACSLPALVGPTKAPLMHIIDAFKLVVKSKLLAWLDHRDGKNPNPGLSFH